MNTAADQVNSSELKDTVRALSTVDENYMKLIDMQQDFINSSSKEQLIKNIESSAPK
jgi:alpha-mannosidase